MKIQLNYLTSVSILCEPSISFSVISYMVQIHSFRDIFLWDSHRICSEGTTHIRHKKELCQAKLWVLCNLWFNISQQIIVNSERYSQCQMAEVSKEKSKKQTNKKKKHYFWRKKQNIGLDVVGNLLLLTSGLYLDKTTKNSFLTISGLGILYSILRVSKSSHRFQLKGISKIKESGREIGRYTET